MANEGIPSKKILRKNLRDRRSSLSSSFQRQKGLEMMRQFIKHPLFLRARKIAAYWPVDGEMDPRFLLEKAWERNKKCYLPVLHPYEKRSLLFTEYKPEDPLRRNRFGILEPQLTHRKPIIPWTLDIVLVPLVAFDNRGRRLGRGAGFYDHTFSFLKRAIKPHPFLIGLGYEFQREEILPQDSWDLTLSGISTEKEFTLFPSYLFLKTSVECANTSCPSTRPLA